MVTPLGKGPSLKLKLSLPGSSSSKSTGAGLSQLPVTEDATPSKKSAGTSTKIRLKALPVQDTEPSTPHAGPSTIRSNVIPSTVESPIPATPSAQPVANGPDEALYATPGSSARSKAKGKGKGKGRLRPSAIPQRLLSSTPSTPRPPLPSQTPTPTTELDEFDTDPNGIDTSAIKVEEEEADPLSLPISPSAMNGSSAATPQEGGPEAETPLTGRQSKAQNKWMRLKKPLKELSNRILVELRRKDEYDLFGEPVDLEYYPDYVQVIGGEDKMMDLGTMQSKVDNDEYGSLNDLQTDLQSLVTAAQKFNLPGSIPYTSAGRLLTLGMKHIDRSRELVRTPSPTRSANDNTPWRGRSVVSGREMTAATDDGPSTSAGKQLAGLAPYLYIPQEMLEFPSGSAAATMIGWNLNGGRRIHPKKVVRSREKFNGKWRHWDLDGTRGVAEMDDPVSAFSEWKTRTGEDRMSITAYRAMRTKAWWEAEPIGGIHGQPPIAFIGFPKPDPLPQRRLDHLEWGVYPDIKAEVAPFARKQPPGPISHSLGVVDNEMDLLGEYLRPLRNKPKEQAAPNFSNIMEEPNGRSAGDWLRDIVHGDVQGEAYRSSVERFIRGAAKYRQPAIMVNAEFTGLKADDGEEGLARSEENTDVDLEQFVMERYHNGLLSTGRGLASTIKDTVAHLNSASDSGSTIMVNAKRPARNDTYITMARDAYARVALRRLGVYSNKLDIQLLLHRPSDFMYTGVGVKDGLQVGFDFVSEELKRIIDYRTSTRVRASPTKGKRKAVEDNENNKAEKRIKMEDMLESADAPGLGTATSASSPLSAPPDSPPSNKGDVATVPGIDLSDGENGLRRLRLELIALSKFYPLAALKKMDKAVAEEMLPPNVRALMSKK